MGTFKVFAKFVVWPSTSHMFLKWECNKHYCVVLDVRQRQVSHADKSCEIPGSLPVTCRVLIAAGDVLLLDTEHEYDPSRLPVTLSEWTYVAVPVSVTRELLYTSLRVSFPLVQETVVAGPPVEVQVRVNTGESEFGSVSNWKLIPPDIVTSPPDRVKQRILCQISVGQQCWSVFPGKFRFKVLSSRQYTGIIFPSTLICRGWQLERNFRRLKPPLRKISLAWV